MTVLTQLSGWTTHPIISLSAASALAVVVGVLYMRRVKAAPAAGADRRKFSAGTLAAVAAFIVCTSVSLNTSYRFTLDGLLMTGTAERVLSCAAFECLIAMCVLGARERLASDKQSPGWFGSAVWIFAALSAVPAWQEGGGFTTGTVVRVIVGSFGAALSAHSALGLELRHRTGAESQSPMALITRDLRERLMATLGLSQRGRTAAKIARDRALSRAVDLADEYDRLSAQDKQKRGPKIAKKLASALDRAGCADDEAQKELFRSRVALRRYATELDIAPSESPWHEGGTTEEDERVVADLEARIRRMEDLADDTEAAVAAQVAVSVGTSKPGRRAGTDDEAQPRDDEHQEDEEETPNPLRDLASYPTKRAALEALYTVRIAEDDPRNVNEITEGLLAELAAAGITLSRPTAHRYITALRMPPTQQDEQGETVQGELVSA